MSPQIRGLKKTCALDPLIPNNPAGEQKSMAQNTFEYRNYRGSIEVDTSDFSLSGKILHIEEDYPYKGDTFEELEEAFKKQVDKHMQACLDAGQTPPFQEEIDGTI